MRGRGALILAICLAAALACSLTLADDANPQGTPVADNSGNNNSASPPTVQIIAPFDGQQVIVGEDIEIQVSAADTIGVTRVQLSVSGRTSSTKSFPETATSAEALLRWRPDRKGTFTLSVTAFRNFTPSEPATLTLHALGRGDTITNPASGQVDARVTAGECVGRVLISNLRRRTGPGTNYTHQNNFDLNEQVTILGKNVDSRSREWLKVKRSSGDENWLINNSDWIELVGSCSDLPTVN